MIPDDKPRSIHESAIVDWENSDVCDEIHKHFTAIEGTHEDWPDVAEEGVRLWRLMFSQTIEEFSPARCVIDGVAAAAYHLAIGQVASKLGCSPLALLLAMEGQDEEGALGFLRECYKPCELDDENCVDTPETPDLT